MKGKKAGIIITFDDLKHYTVKDLLAGKQLLDDIHGASIDRKGLKYVSVTLIIMNPLTMSYDYSLSTNIPKDDPDLDVVLELLPKEILDELKDIL